MTALAIFFTIVGTWHGTLHQSGVKPFTVTASIRSGVPHSTVQYSGLDCRGSWTFLSRTADTYRFRETITAGRSTKCKGTGIVTLQVVGAHLQYTFRGGGVVARGLLYRR